MSDLHLSLPHLVTLQTALQIRLPSLQYQAQDGQIASSYSRAVPNQNEGTKKLGGAGI